MRLSIWLAGLGLIAVLAGCGRPGGSPAAVPDRAGTSPSRGVTGLPTTATPPRASPATGDAREVDPAPQSAGQEDNSVTATPPRDDSANRPTDSLAGTVPAPEFPAGLAWLNSRRPLTMADLRGKVVVLDFWTYGCINCLHVIPDLKRLEEKYHDVLVVIGVHSAKFANEGETESISQIIQRYELEHPVVNDRDFQVWRSYGVQAWPTLVVIDPAGKVVGYHAGEGIYDLFDQAIGRLVLEFDARDEVNRDPLDLVPEGGRQPDSPLRFPGKVLADPAGGRLFIADSNHNRIVVTDFDGRVLEVIGSGLPEFRDGDFTTAGFFRPQGLTLAGSDTLYVADTENHALRRVDLARDRVVTVAGVGRQVYQRATRGPAWSTGLNSPWDVLYHDGLVYIAMAGQHQLWTYDPAREEIALLAGSGREELSDGPQLQAGLNQPSGLATDGERLYFADSEASAIRSAGLSPEGNLATIVGTGLFDFGDVDGVGDAVRLQHPLGLAYAQGLIYVADTYNHKIKVVDPGARTSTTLAGSGRAGWRDGPSPLFAEPGGLSIAGNRLYVADTNNHAIRVLDLEQGQTGTLVLIDSEGHLTRQPDRSPYSGVERTLPAAAVAPGGGFIRLEVLLPAGYKVNELAPLSVSWSLDGAGGDLIDFVDGERQVVVDPAFPLDFPVTFHPGAGRLTAELVVYYCEAAAESLCFIDQVRISLPLTVATGNPARLDLVHTIPPPP